MDRDTYTNVDIANYIDQHFVANYVIIYSEDVSTQKDNRGAPLICTANTAPKHTLDGRRSAEQQKLVKQYYKGYISRVPVLDAHGEALYNDSGELDFEHIEDIFRSTLGIESPGFITFGTYAIHYTMP